MQAFTSARPQAARAPQRALVISSAKFRPQSRIGKKPVDVPKEVNVTLKDNHLVVKVCPCPLQRRFPQSPAAPVRMVGWELWVFNT